MKLARSGFTVVELLMVLAIISLLVGLLLPAMALVRKTARETKQKAQFATIELTLATFKNDYGDYPPSAGWDYTTKQVLDYCGAQKLAEALVGWDLLGFHPKSDWLSTGRNRAGAFIYDANNALLLDQRKGPYLELATANVFRLGNISPVRPGLFRDTRPLAPDTFVLCDVFTYRKVLMPNGKTISAGSPVLYYRANTSQKVLEQIYEVRDNDALVVVKQQNDIPQRAHPLADPASSFRRFYDYIRDPKVTAKPMPYRSDTYILISAGADGIYGTDDDIRNFGD